MKINRFCISSYSEIMTFTMTMSMSREKSEYQRLNGHLPVELECLVKEYAQPVYRKPYHHKVFSPLLSGMKMVIIRHLLYQNCPQCRMCTHAQALKNAHYRREQAKLLGKQTGELFEEESRDILRDILRLVQCEKELRNKRRRIR